MELDLVRLRLRYWIDGKPLDDMSKSLPAGKAWIPAVHFTEKDLEVILNPFCVSSDAAYSSGLISKALRELHDDSKSGGQHSLPACLSQSMATYQRAFVASQLAEYLIAYNFQTQDSAGKALPDHEVLKQVEKLSTKEDLDAVKAPEAKEESKEEVEEAESSTKKAETEELSQLPKFEKSVILSSANEASQEEGSPAEKAAVSKLYYVLLRFESEQDALKYLVQAKKSQCTLSFFSGPHIAKLLQIHLQDDEDEPTLAAHFPHVGDVQQLAADLVKMLETNDLISPKKRERIQSYLGVQPAVEGSDHSQDLTKIISSIKADRLGDQLGSNAVLSTDRAAAGALVQALYLPASDKVLLSRNNELKLVSRGSGGNREFFAEPASVHFGNRL